MNIEELADVVETMIIQHDYPGFEPRALILGLPLDAVNSPAKVFSQALRHESIFVQLAALRWFQVHPGVVKNYLPLVVDLLKSEDEYVRLEGAKTLERGNAIEPAPLLALAACLKDPKEMVRTAAAKALGKLLSKADDAPDPNIVAALKEAAADPDEQVRWKAQKALRKLGAYSN
jgi:HEAT repeat protein